MSEDEQLEKEINEAKEIKKQADAKVKRLKDLAEAINLKRQAEEKIQRLHESQGTERPENSTSEASRVPFKIPIRDKAKEVAELISGLGWIFIIAGIAALAIKFLYGWEILFSFMQYFEAGIIFLIFGSFIEALLKPKSKEPEKGKRRPRQD